MEKWSRILKAVDYLEDNLIEDVESHGLRIDVAAKKAALSPWYFQRIFDSLAGESVGCYVRKRRLTLAIEYLCSSRDGILQVAQHFGYQSQEAFGRAFKSYFNVTPNHVRKHGLDEIPSYLLKKRIQPDYLFFIVKENVMEPKFVTFPETKIVGFGSRFISILSEQANAKTVIGPLWDKFFKSIGNVTARKNTRTIGFCLPIPRSKESSEQRDECFYLAGVEVDSTATIPAGMEVRIVPEGRYAVFTHKGKLDKLEHTMRYIYGTWHLNSKIELREAPDLEIYDERFDENSDASEFDIYIPIV